MHGHGSPRPGQPPADPHPAAPRPAPSAPPAARGGPPAAGTGAVAGTVPGSRTAAGVCHGTLGELYQGPLRAGGAPDIALVSFPVDRHSWAYFTPGAGRPGALPPGEKAARAVRLFLDHFGLRLPPGHWSTHSELRVGVGMASSTADIVATLRCLFRLFGLPYDQGVVTGVLAAIERADSVFLDEFALHLSARHQVVRTLGTGIGFHTAFVTEPGTVDTSAVTAPLLRHYARRASEYERCLTDLLKGFESADPAAVARAATTSATLSQQVLPKRTFARVLAHREHFGADGIFVAHTGSLIGYLFAHRPPAEAKSELSAFFHSLGHQCSFAQGGYG
ncbi:GHMP family kinase ATP-binding protein [Streptomyces buecherae]|uniref:GHMP family kinase ATP-binding protein n=1 Tax=Streptomyces buecherae TaxID=2763006 RepID=UPI00366323F1